MRLHRLRIESFAAIGNVDLEFGPGLNVLYGPNDLGKSTVVAAIRLGFLLPHTSTNCDQYVGWTGSDDPIVEMTFETEAQRIWRVRKQFGKSGSSLLQESRNGQDFDDVERGRKVDAKLREILRWGIPEPGGPGGAKGLPTSFLATVLLSPQDDVSAVLRNSLRDDSTGSGKEQIAAALQAVAQDPLFVTLLREAQGRRDAAYTDKGAKKTAKGSVFKLAAERLKETRDEKEKLQRIVSDSEGAERQLRDLTNQRAHKQETLAVATDLVANLEKLALQAGCRSVAAEQVRLTHEDVLRIQRIGTEVDAAECEVAKLIGKIGEAEQALNVARARQVEADAALEAAEEASRAEGSDPGMTDMVVRQHLEFRRSAADQAVRETQLRIDAALAAQKLVEAEVAAERELQEQQAKADSALESAFKATATAKTADDELQRCDLLERALDVHAADEQTKEAQAAVDNEAALRTRLEAASGERAVLAGQRSAITVPIPGALGSMRKLTTELAAARGALDVGFVVTVSPKARLELRVRKDGQEVDSTSIAQPLDIEANAEVEVSIADIATVRVRGGRREAQEKAQGLEDRWSREVGPHLIAAGVTDLDGLDAKIAEAQELDAGIKMKDAEIESLRGQIAALTGAAETLREASDRAAARRASLGDVGLDALAADIKALGADVTAGLRKRRQQLSKEAEAARRIANQAANDRTLADERTRHSRLALDVASAARDAALTAFPEGVDAALVAAQAALVADIAEKESVTAEFASLDRTIEERKNRIDAALSGARANAAQATIAVETAQERLTTAKTNQAAEHGRLIELRKRRDAEDLAAAEARLHEATERHAALPLPDRIVTDDEVSAARTTVVGLKLDLEGIERDIQRAHGALEQVGGAVARERLRDATEAFELAERQEREIEAEYEAWRLLLDQMKEADAAQASNLGQALVPAIAGRFQELTQRRYDTIQLAAQLATEGIMVSGALRPAAQISVGTREQLSTLYRLSLAEYLHTTIVLDDQLVQSEGNRMDWFRALLTEKAHSFQIVVFTCRPGDYLLASALVPPGSAVHADTDGGFIRAVDLGRALRRR
jgi:energy-coupling factor transporter ATP-binding protein EcfA2